MKILVLDKNTTTVNDDIDFSGFNQFGEMVIHENLNDPEAVINATNGVDVVVVNKVYLTDAIINRLPSSVKLIAITATGYDNVDVTAASKRGIKVANVPGYGTNAVSQLVIFLMLSCAIQFVPQLDYMREKGWDKMAGLAIPMHELAGKTLGIIGLGEIGIATAKLALAFGMKVVAYNRSIKNIDGIKQLELYEVAKYADFISLNCALTKDTAKIINEEFLTHMKPTAYLINTARGGLIDEVALSLAIKNKQIAGAALDVLSSEPPLADNPLLGLGNVLLTPHIGWAPVEARQRCIDITVANIAAFISKNPLNLLN
jgi:glycerate dehydrogenase